MTTFNDIGLTKTVFNKLTQTQFDNATEISDTEFYLVNPEYTGGKYLVTTETGDVVEGPFVYNITDGDTVALQANAIYNAGTIATLNLTLPTNGDMSFISQISFTNNSTSSAVITPSTTMKWIGDDCVENVFTPQTNYRYTIMITYDGQNWVGYSRGVK